MLACTSRPQFSLSAMNATEVTLSISTHSDHICFSLVSLKKVRLEGISGGHAVLASCLMQSKTSKKLDQVAQGLVQPMCKNFQRLRLHSLCGYLFQCQREAKNLCP